MCAERAFAKWRGWPHKSAVPLLPPLAAGSCVACGSTEELSSEGIAWVNHHESYSTGLPDYWCLGIDHDPSHWGRPYHAEADCPNCTARTIISEMRYPNGKREFMHNCAVCGVLRTR